MIELEADVIVCAAGLSGLAASVAAAELGAKVITFEKSNATGGAANMGISPLAVGSRQQRMAGYNYTPEEIFEKHMHYVHWKADARLVMEYYRKTASTIEWLENMGVQFVFEGNTKYTPVRMKAYASAEQVRHPVSIAPGAKVAPRAASAMTKKMTERFIELGGDLRLESPATSVIMEDGRAIGVKAKAPDGEEITAYADAVILACGGYGDNPKWIKENLGFEWGKDLFSFRIPGNVGDGLRMAWEAGAGKEPSIMELMYQIPDNLNHFALEGAFRQPLLWVNKLGRRFIPEDVIGNTGITGNAIAYQPFKTCFAIMDEDTLAYYKARGVDFPGVQGEDVFDHFDEAAGKRRMKDISIILRQIPWRNWRIKPESIKKDFWRLSGNIMNAARKDTMILWVRIRPSCALLRLRNFMRFRVSREHTVHWAASGQIISSAVSRKIIR